MKFIVFTSQINKLNDQDEVSLYLKKYLKLEDSTKFRAIFPENRKYKVEDIKLFVKSLTKKKDLENEFINVIMNAELLSDVAQNTLLKTLEESPYSIILLTSNIDAILPTIVSRCQVLYDTDNSVELDSTDEFNLKNLSSYAKIDRAILIEKLTNKLKSDEIANTIFYQDAIDKLNSNCKVESVLIELIQRIDR